MLDTELQRYVEENAARWGMTYMQVVRKMLVESSDAACLFEVSRYTIEQWCENALRFEAYGACDVLHVEVDV